MGIALFYWLALIPIAIGGYLWISNRTVIWQEWLIGAGVALLTAGIFHFSILHSLTADSETWSGQIVGATHFPAWEEEYTVTVTDTHTRSDGKGGTETYTTTRQETRYRWHPQRWEAHADIGSQAIDRAISSAFYNELTRAFGNKKTQYMYKSGFHSGDPNIYVTTKRTPEILYPITVTKTWTNKVKAAPTLFSFPKVPEGTPVFEWPSNHNWLSSDRLVGNARQLISTKEWDQLNTRLGAMKKVNLILVGFPEGTPQEIGLLQEAKWMGGKKNDLVICFAGLTKETPASWAYVFGWTENFELKRNLESLLLSQPASPELFAQIETMVRQDYQIKDWRTLDYITVEPPTWAYLVFFAILLLTQGGLYWYFHHNQYNEDRRAWKASFRPRFQ